MEGSKFEAGLTVNAVQYAWRQLARRAGVTGGAPSGTGFEALGLPVHYDHPQDGKGDEACLIVVPCQAGSMQKLLDQAPGSLTGLPPSRVFPDGRVPPGWEPIPVLIWGAGYEDGRHPFARIEERRLVFYADILASAFFCLSRWEETVNAVRDIHGRFPAQASVASRQGFLDRPVVDEYGMILQAWLESLLPRWTPRMRRFEAKISHDIDSIYTYPNLLYGLKTLGGDLLKRRSIHRAALTYSELLSQVLFPERLSHYRAIHLLAEVSKQHGLTSAFYFMSAKPAPMDGDYDVESPLMRKCIETLQNQGFEIGFHPGYDTFDDPERLASEKARLDKVLGTGQYGGRQHFLRFRPATWRHWAQLGLAYDSTVGYPEQEGFRCGTCHPFHPFDLEADAELDILEYPLIVMDATLRRYRKLSPVESEEIILNMAEKCRRVGGVFTFLWHNTAFGNEGSPWDDVYRRSVARLATLMAADRPEGHVDRFLQ